MARRFKAIKRARPKTSFLKTRSFWYGAASLFLGLALAYVLLLSPLFQVQAIEVQGASKVSKEQLTNLAWEEVWQPFAFVPTASILVADSARIEKSIKGAFPVFESVSVRRSLPATLVIEVQERTQVATWCPPAQAGNEGVCFALDKKGIVFEEVQATESMPLLSFQEDKSAGLGERLIDQDLLGIFLDVQTRLRDSSLSIVQFENVPQDRVEATTKEGWQIIFTPKESIEWQLTKFELVLDQQIPAEKREELEYVDLRFGDQAFVKYQD